MTQSRKKPPWLGGWGARLVKGTAWAEVQRQVRAGREEPGRAGTKSVCWVGNRFEKLGVWPDYGRF